MEFSMIPLDKGDSFSDYVARILTIVDSSGLDYRLNPMSTVVEGHWDDLLALLTRCFRALEKDSGRISLTVKFDHRQGRESRIEKKVQSVQAKSGRTLKTS
jgi:uncharacterized protein (TIGR00106 family)